MEFFGKWKAVEENWKAAEENWKAVAKSRKALRKVEGQMVGMVEWRGRNGRMAEMATYVLFMVDTH